MGGVTQERQELSQGRMYTREPTEEAGKKEYCGSLNGFDITDSYICCALKARPHREASESASWWSEPERSVADVGLRVFSILHTGHDCRGTRQPCGS